jgi:hypothetical protein
MHNATLKTLLKEITEYLTEHPEHGDLPVYVPYDSRMAETTVHGGIRFEADEYGEGGCIIIEGDS